MQQRSLSLRQPSLTSQSLKKLDEQNASKYQDDDFLPAPKMPNNHIRHKVSFSDASSDFSSSAFPHHRSQPLPKAYSAPKTIKKYVPSPNGLVMVEVPLEEEQARNRAILQHSRNSSLKGRNPISRNSSLSGLKSQERRDRVVYSTIQEEPRTSDTMQERLQREREDLELNYIAKVEAERLYKEQLERKRAALEKLERERIKREYEDERVKQEQLKQELILLEKLEQERLAQDKLEQERIEEERLELEKSEVERIEKERHIELAKIEENRLAELAKIEEEKQVELARIEKEKTAELERLEVEKLAEATKLEVEEGKEDTLRLPEESNGVAEIPEQTETLPEPTLDSSEFSDVKPVDSIVTEESEDTIKHSITNELLDESFEDNKSDNSAQFNEKISDDKINDSSRSAQTSAGLSDGVSPASTYMTEIDSSEEVTDVNYNVKSHVPMSMAKQLRPIKQLPAVQINDIVVDVPKPTEEIPARSERRLSTSSFNGNGLTRKKSALKQSQRYESAKQKNPSNAASQAYLSLTTAENTRLNALNTLSSTSLVQSTSESSRKSYVPPPQPKLKKQSKPTTTPKSKRTTMSEDPYGRPRPISINLPQQVSPGKFVMPKSETQKRAEALFKKANSRTRPTEEELSRNLPPLQKRSSFEKNREQQPHVQRFSMRVELGPNPEYEEKPIVHPYQPPSNFNGFKSRIADSDSDDDIRMPPVSANARKATLAHEPPPKHPRRPELKQEVEKKEKKKLGGKLKKLFGKSSL